MVSAANLNVGGRNNAPSTESMFYFHIAPAQDRKLFFGAAECPAR
jgi:hypothetical protein